MLSDADDLFMDYEQSTIRDLVLLLGFGMVAGALLGTAFGLASLAWAARAVR